MKAAMMISRLTGAVRKLARNTRGVAAVEAAILLPVMLMVYLGTNQIAMAIATYRKVDLAANTVSNLVAQYTTITTSELTDVLSASTQVMYPSASANMQVVVSLISVNAQGTAATVTWSQAQNATARAIGASVTLPSSLMVANTSVVLGEVSYPYNAAVDYLNLGTINLYSSIYMVPRASTTINLSS